MKKNGFTLVELMITLALMGILAAVAISAARRQSWKKQMAKQPDTTTLSQTKMMPVQQPKAVNNPPVASEKHCDPCAELNRMVASAPKGCHLERTFERGEEIDFIMPRNRGGMIKTDTDRRVHIFVCYPPPGRNTKPRLSPDGLLE